MGHPILEYYSAMNRSENPRNATAWKDLKDMVFTGRTKSKGHIVWVSRTGNAQKRRIQRQEVDLRILAAGKIG